MRILFDQGVPAPLRSRLPEHVVETAFERGWSKLNNGELLNAAEAEFDMLITTDGNLEYQQNLRGRRIAILVLPTTSWPRLQGIADKISGAVDALRVGEYKKLSL